MGKHKLQRFAELKTFNNYFEPPAQAMYEGDFELKGKWQRDYFKNNNPIVVELGCGKGEYTTGLAARFPDKNFIGMDIKGARLWRGCKTAIEQNLKNVAFIRNKIEFVNSFFAPEEISEIWITFPDPQLKKMRKRLTSARFLNNYKKILKPGGIVHLKTDSAELYKFTNELLKHNKITAIFSTPDLYRSNYVSDILEIKTFYEQKFLEINKPITYTKFQLDDVEIFENPDCD